MIYAIKSEKTEYSLQKMIKKSGKGNGKKILNVVLESEMRNWKGILLLINNQKLNYFSGPGVL